MSALVQARTAAATFLERSGKPDQALLVRAGGGDDFAEVVLALQAQEDTRAQTDLFRRALANYADASFWEADVPEASLAYHDQGAIARSVLAGRELFAMHRD